MRVVAQLFSEVAQVKMFPVGYKSAGQSVPALIAGDVQMLLIDPGPVAGLIKAGKVKALAVTTPTRSPIAPELPTMIEAGIAGYEATFGDVLLAPRGTPPAVIAALNETIGAALSQPDVKGKMVARGVEYVANTPEQAAARVRREAEKWAGVVERLGLKAD